MSNEYYYNEIIEKYKDDIETLEKIAHEQNNKLNYSIVFITIKTKSEEESQYVLRYFEEKGIEIIYEDIEPDEINNESEIDNESGEIPITPFDPSRIDIRFSQMTISSIIERIRNKELDFETDFQRKAGLWEPLHKSQLIESILLRIPLPAFYFDATDDDKWLIIDGLQRVSTIKEFIVDKKMKLTGLEFLNGINGKTFDELPRSMQRRITETNITAYIVNPATPANVKFNIFKRINTGGLVLEPQEIRNALFQGKATAFLKRLSENPCFIKATCNSINSERMLDREFCLRYIAFTSFALDNYRGNLDDYLNDTMRFINKSDDESLHQMESDFEKVMNINNMIFGKHAFRKMGSDGRRRPINKALFEAWSNVIYNMDDSDRNKLVLKKDCITNKFIDLCCDYRFQGYLKNSDRYSLWKRIDEIEKLVDDVLELKDDRTN